MNIELREILSNPKPAGRNQLVSNCPFCNKSGHFYINKDTYLWDCKKCGENGNIKKLLFKLGRYDLTSTVFNLDHIDVNILGSQQKQESLELDLPEISYPTGFKRQFQNDYLDKRGFEKHHYYKYEVGTAKINPKFDKYVIIGVYQNHSLVGFLSRHTWDKAKIKRYENKNNTVVFRYKNSIGSQFSKILLGYDEIKIGKTETVILVEGFFKKLRVDNLFELDDSDAVKCCATFGKKVSQQQIELLKMKHVKNVILVQDSDAVIESKRDSFMLQEHFNTFVGFVGNGGALDDCSERDFFQTFDNLEKPENYFFGKVPILTGV